MKTLTLFAEALSEYNYLRSASDGSGISKVSAAYGHFAFLIFLHIFRYKM